jgi:L-seryl-tRNA(Ser) seleniumtransferase
MKNPGQKTMSSEDQTLQLRRLPAITELLNRPETQQWRESHPLELIKHCLRRAVDRARHAAQAGQRGEGMGVEAILAEAGAILAQDTTPRVREAINATGILLHTGLGRAVYAGSVVDSMMGALKGYCTLAVDVSTGERAERDELVESILTELTGAEAATVVNNNAAATLLVLAGLTSGREVIVSRGQLIEIGGSFRLPEVMAQSGARLVEVGATNRTHLKDYRAAMGDQTEAILRVHPSNYRVVGFTSQVGLRELAELAHGRGLILIDDLGAGALLDLTSFGLPAEPTVRESIVSGADIVLFSGDKLIGAAQCGIIVGRKDLVTRLRKHPLMRAVRVDKTCLLVLERTLHLFRDLDRLRAEHPLYRMLSTPLEQLHERGVELLRLIAERAPAVTAELIEGVAYLGSGSLPTETIPSIVVALTVPAINAEVLARRLRTDESCIFGRIENDRVRLDLRTVTGEQLPRIAAALSRIVPR